MYPIQWLLALAVMALAPGRAIPQGPCRPLDATGVAFIKQLTGLTEGRSPDKARRRATLHLPAVSKDRIGLVSRESICRRADHSYRQRLAKVGSGLSGQVHVVRVGDVFAVLDPAFYGPEPGVWTVVILDAEFRPLAAY